MQIRKIKVELVMLIIEEASLCMTTMNYQHATAGSLETYEYFKRLSMSLIKHQSSNLKRSKMDLYSCVPQNLQYTFYKS